MQSEHTVCWGHVDIKPLSARLVVVHDCQALPLNWIRFEPQKTKKQTNKQTNKQTLILWCTDNLKSDWLECDWIWEWVFIRQCLYVTVLQYVSYHCFTIGKSPRHGGTNKKSRRKKAGMWLRAHPLSQVSHTKYQLLLLVSMTVRVLHELWKQFFFFMISTCNVNVQCMTMQVGNLVVKQVLNLRDTFSVVFLLSEQCFELIVVMTMWRRQED